MCDYFCTVLFTSAVCVKPLRAFKMWVILLNWCVKCYYLFKKFIDVQFVWCMSSFFQSALEIYSFFFLGLWYFCASDDDEAHSNYGMCFSVIKTCITSAWDSQRRQSMWNHYLINVAYCPFKLSFITNVKFTLNLWENNPAALDRDFIWGKPERS